MDEAEESLQFVFASLLSRLLKVFTLNKDELFEGQCLSTETVFKGDFLSCRFLRFSSRERELEIFL